MNKLRRAAIVGFSMTIYKWIVRDNISILFIVN